jgi:hypothetical protein
MSATVRLQAPNHLGAAWKVTASYEAPTAASIG